MTSWKLIQQQSQPHQTKLQLVSSLAQTYGTLAWVSITHTRRPLTQTTTITTSERGTPAATTTTLVDAAAAELDPPPPLAKPTVTTVAGGADLSIKLRRTCDFPSDR